MSYYFIDYVYVMQSNGELFKVDMDDILYPAIEDFE